MIVAKFYRTGAGNETVRNWLKELNRTNRKVIGDDVQTAPLGWQMGVVGW